MKYRLMRGYKYYRGDKSQIHIIISTVYISQASLAKFILYAILCVCFYLCYDKSNKQIYFASQHTTTTMDLERHSIKHSFTKTSWDRLQRHSFITFNKDHCSLLACKCIPVQNNKDSIKTSRSWNQNWVVIQISKIKVPLSGWNLDSLTYPLCYASLLITMTGNKGPMCTEWYLCVYYINIIIIL